jgi:hypothetical protein
MGPMNEQARGKAPQVRGLRILGLTPCARRGVARTRSPTLKPHPRRFRATTGARPVSVATYRVLLAPGTYTVVAPQYRRGSGVTPDTVRVPKGRIAHVDLEIDTGIQ